MRRPDRKLAGASRIFQWLYFGNCEYFHFFRADAALWGRKNQPAGKRSRKRRVFWANLVNSRAFGGRACEVISWSRIVVLKFLTGAWRTNDHH
jgi:hypothetical protein